jgi:putative pyruvate formate lyase activating enzyme
MDYKHCRLCPRNCGVDRTQGQRGVCGMGDRLTAARAALHFWEEPPISGERGSGAVFFSGCPLGCDFCQNTEISHDKFGAELTTQRLREIFETLIAQGAHNINLVTATHFLPSILPALEPKLPVPVVYNCGGYESVETLKALEGKVDIYLPDLKYAEADLAARLSRAPDYFPVACRAIDEMVRQTGPCQFDENGMLQKGVIIRHLILPGQVQNSLKVLDYIADHFPKHTVLLSLMAQYVPSGRIKHTPPYDRTITQEEYDAVVDYLYMLGLEEGFLQEPASATAEYLPDFSLEGIL